jgi:hypothetical protein
MRTAPRCSFLTLLALLGVATPAAALYQDPGAPPPGFPLERWFNLDGVAIVVNSDPITQRALERYLQKRAAERKITTEAERQYLIFDAQMKQVEALLMRQAGEDLGFQKEAVEAHIASQIDDKKQEAGGIHELSQRLRQDATTQKKISEDLETELYENSFKRRVLGVGGPQERSSEDRYIRPGVLARQYRHIRRTGLDIRPLVSVGASPALYELQVLLLAPESYGSLQAAQQAAQQAHAALVAGTADWDDLIDTIGVHADRGLVGALPIEDLRFGLDPGDNSLVQFVMEGRQDVYSPVLPFPQPNTATGERRVAAFAIYRLVGRQPAKLPDFGAVGVQKILGRSLEIQADAARLDAALAELMRSAYIWYQGIEEEQAAQEAKQAELEAEVEELRQRNARLLREAREKARESSARDS